MTAGALSNLFVAIGQKGYFITGKYIIIFKKFVSNSVIAGH